jgi:hypothetical protein
MIKIRKLACTAILLLASCLSALPVCADETKGLLGEIAYIVNDYRYDPAGSGGDPDTGHALCATRCNALSFDYADYVMADGREVKRVATDREITVPLDNPFMKGNCICAVDEYQIKPNTRNRAKQESLIEKPAGRE